ncbi:hypothetical protein [Streptomyces sp. NPDC015131]|uniref:hypothetical protein n=1 Tax=Streptomyces sp. NPDC015131 TaxID=3364941 RepID=UPI0036F6212A
MNPNTPPPDGSTGAQSAPQPENDPSDTEAANGAQAGTEGLTLADHLEVAEYRHDHGHLAWAWRCWGDESCDGWLSLDHTSVEAATRAARKHHAEEHATAATYEPKEPRP